MSYHKNIELFKVIVNFVSPLAEAPEISSVKHIIGDTVLIIDDEVWVRNWGDSNTFRFSKAIYTPDFVRMNKKLFEPIL